MGTSSSFQQRKRGSSAAPASSFARPIRPFAPLPSPSSQTTHRDVRASLDHAARFGHSFATIPLFPTVQRKATLPSLPQEGNHLYSRIQAARSSGRPLDRQTQRQLERGLGTDLSGVRVHSDSEADRLSRSINAAAFTTGADIFFRSGMYNPGSSQGLHLLAHEATHVVQQAIGPVAGAFRVGSMFISDPKDHFEQASEARATMISTGFLLNHKVTPISHDHIHDDHNTPKEPSARQGRMLSGGITTHIQRDVFSRQGVGSEKDRFETEPFEYGKEPVIRQRPVRAYSYISRSKGSKETPLPISFEGITSDPLRGYHSGHIIAYELGGPGHPFNIVPMLAAFNTGPWKAWENETGRHADAVKRGSYRVHILLRYMNPEDPRVPTHFNLFREYLTDQGWAADGGPVHMEHRVEEVGLTEEQAKEMSSSLSEAQKSPGNAPAKFQEILYSTQFRALNIDRDMLAAEFSATGHLPALGLAYPADYKHRPYEELDILYLSGRLDVALTNGLNIGEKFTENQRFMIRRANMVRNHGKLMSDDPRDPYQELDINGKEDRPEIDHIIPRDRGGSNFFSNARVISWALNNRIDRIKTPSAFVDPELVRRHPTNSVDNAVVEVLIRSGGAKMTLAQIKDGVQKYRETPVTQPQENTIKELLKELTDNKFVIESADGFQWVPPPSFRKPSL